MNFCAKKREKVLKFLKNIKFFSLSVTQMHFMYIYSKATAFLTLPILVDRPLIYNIYFTKVSSKAIRNTNDVDSSQPNTHLNILHFLKKLGNIERHVLPASELQCLDHEKINLICM